MRRIKFLSIIASALLLSLSFTSCEELEGLINDDEEEVSGDQAFFPASYSQRKVAAWYSLTEEKENGKKIEAVFLFDDNSFVVTKNRIYTDGRSNERTIMAEGDYRIIEGDYTNGKAQVAVNGESDPMLVTITDGVMNAMGENFVKQDNKKVPKASEPTGEGGEGGEGQGGGDGDGGIEAFFPTDFSGKAVTAWFSEAGKISEQGFKMEYNTSIYFFSDGIFLGTAHTVVEGPQGPIPTKTISITGEYTILKGDFTNGDIELKGADGKAVTVQIREGKLTGIEAEGGQVTIYIKQDNSKVPQPSEPTNNGQQGGEGQGGEDGEVPAFFPSSYAGSTVVAWYSFTEGESAETRVEAVFLLEGNLVVVTEHKVFGKEIGMNPERYILATGKYQIREGDYDNCAAIVILDNQRQLQIKIVNGVLTIQDIYGEYTRRDLADVPDPLDPSIPGGEGQGGEGEGGEGEGGEGQGGEGVEYNGVPVPYLPESYDSKTIAAWYLFSNTGNGVVSFESVFLFTDGSLVVTKSKFYNVGDGRDPEYKINAEGQYQMTEGSDYSNGTAQVVLSDGMTMEVSIEEGVLFAMNTEFDKQDNETAPVSIKNIKK